MYKWFKIERFRAFRRLELEDLGCINLIAGKNNVGKTALLESLFVHSGAYNPQLAFNLRAFRGLVKSELHTAQWRTTPWDDLFYEFDNSREIVFRGDDGVVGRRDVRLRQASGVGPVRALLADIEPYQSSIGEAAFEFEDGSLQVSLLPNDGYDDTVTPQMRLRALALRYEEPQIAGTQVLVMRPDGLTQYPGIPPAPPYPCIFVSTRRRCPPDDAKRFGELVANKIDDTVLRALKKLEPRLKRLAVVHVADEPVLHGDIGLQRMLPLSFIGDGVARLASIILDIAASHDGVVLIDEVEAALHFSAIPDVWRAISAAASEFNVQVFATTHSVECIRSAADRFADDKTFRFIRIERTRNGRAHRAATYAGDALQAAIKMDIEVR